MLCGIFSGVTWALGTVILGIALSMAPFVSSTNGLFLTPFVSTFIHTGVSALFLLAINGGKGRLREIFSICKTKTFGLLILSSAIGGPIGMTGYALTVDCMGASIGAVASAVYPAIGAVLAYVFLKEKIKWYQWIFLICTLIGVFGLGYSPEIDIKNFGIGLLGVFMCSFGWGAEGVMLSKCMHDKGIKSDDALQLRQIISTLIFGLIIILYPNGVHFTAGLFSAANMPVMGTIAASAFFITVSYSFYYRAIFQIGTAKAMGLNITYTAWAIFFSVVLLHEYSVLNFKTIGCAVLVVVFGVLAAVDLKELFRQTQSKSNSNPQ